MTILDCRASATGPVDLSRLCPDDATVTRVRLSSARAFGAAGHRDGKPRGFRPFRSADAMDDPGLEIDVATRTGRDIFHGLVRTADVLLQNYNPGVAARLGADFATIREINPRITYLTLYRR